MRNLLSIVLPKRVSRGNDVRAGDFNAIIDTLEQIQHRIQSITLHSSADIAVKAQPSGGTLAWIKRGGRGGGGSSAPTGYIPWKPNFFTETVGTGELEETVYKVRFNLGTLNNVAATNWDADHTVPEGVVRWVILTISSAAGKVSALTISLDSSPLAEDFVNKNTPPTTWKILLGFVSHISGSMIETKNLNAIATEIYRESKTVVSAGGEPFDRWWRWNHTEV